VNKQPPNIALVGATGLVGREILTLIEERDFPFQSIRIYASDYSTGITIPFNDGELTVQSLTENEDTLFHGIDIVLLAVDGRIAQSLAPRAVRAGATVIDNSSAFRMDSSIPLIIPEINPEAIRAHGIIANPNCSTIIMLMAITPIRKLFGVKRIVVSTYQAASGAGVAAMCELRDQSQALLSEKKPVCRAFDEVCAFNVFSHNSPVGEDGYHAEERKMINETRKIWVDDSVAITASCVRVPVFRAHCDTINLTLEKPITENDLATIRSTLSASPGLSVVDDRAGNRFPTARLASAKDDIFVGRLRLDRSQMTPDGSASHGLELFIAGDQIRKGAALNALQIAEHLINQPV